jgi:hypothetical protein
MRNSWLSASIRTLFALAKFPSSVLSTTNIAPCTCAQVSIPVYTHVFRYLRVVTGPYIADTFAAAKVKEAHSAAVEFGLAGGKADGGLNQFCCFYKNISLEVRGAVCYLLEGQQRPWISLPIPTR